MSDSSEEEDLSRFRDVVDTSFTKLINESRGHNETHVSSKTCTTNQKSERYLEIASHYNDIKVPAEMQKQIGAKISAIIQRNFEFTVLENGIKKRKIKGGVKLFKNSEGYLKSEEAKDIYTESHNTHSKKLKKKKRNIDTETVELNENDKITAVTVTGDYVLSKEETKCWKSRRKEILFKYKRENKSKILTAVI